MAPGNLESRWSVGVGRSLCSVFFWHLVLNCGATVELEIRSFLRTTTEDRRRSTMKSQRPTTPDKRPPLRARRFLAAQRQEVLRALDRLGDFAEEFFQVFVVINEVDFRGIDDEQVGRGVVKEKVLVGLDDFFKIIVVDGLLAGRVFLLETFLQNLRRGLQVDDEIGCRQLLAKEIVVAVVGFEFLVAEVEASEKFIFLEDKIRDHCALRMRAEIERAQLLEAPDQECELRLERGAAITLVERAQERILLGLNDALRIQTIGEDSCQRALADSDGAFDCDVAGTLEKIRHGLAGDYCRIS